MGRPARPVTFVASVRLGDPPRLAVLRNWLRENPGLRFKLDPTPRWDDAFVDELARLDCVDVVDMKGSYRNLSVAMEPEPALYQRVLEGLPDAWIEDPAFEPGNERCLSATATASPGTNRSTRSPTSTRCRGARGMLNVKPARLGSLAGAVRCI